MSFLGIGKKKKKEPEPQPKSLDQRIQEKRQMSGLKETSGRILTTSGMQVNRQVPNEIIDPNVLESAEEEYDKVEEAKPAPRPVPQPIQKPRQAPQEPSGRPQATSPQQPTVKQYLDAIVSDLAMLDARTKMLAGKSDMLAWSQLRLEKEQADLMALIVKMSAEMNVEEPSEEQEGLTKKMVKFFGVQKEASEEETVEAPAPDMQKYQEHPPVQEYEEDIPVPVAPAPQPKIRVQPQKKK